MTAHPHQPALHLPVPGWEAKKRASQGTGSCLAPVYTRGGPRMEHKLCESWAAFLLIHKPHNYSLFVLLMQLLFT